MLFGSRLNRLATSIRRGISKYSVGSDNPGLVFDFIDNFYQKDKNQTVNFDGAITHARSGNAVMTDGYGPELVVNGGFDSDSDWSKGTGWSIADGVATHTGSAGYLQQTGIVETGKVYELSFRITAIGSGEVFAYGINSFGVGGTTTGTYTGLVTATNANIRFRATGEASIDNVSVREMPVLKWAPHNRIPNSNGFGSWTESAEVDLTVNNATAPDGTQTASTLSCTTDATNHGINLLRQWTDGQTNFAIFVRRASSGISSILIGQNNLAQRSTHTISDDWQLITNTRASGSDRLVIHFPSGSNGESIEIWGAHLYRSDLGGMVDNPDRGDSYVPTTSSAKYLPRIGHHVYNGSAWVNEGVLAESESRVNYVTDSSLGGWSEINAPITTNSEVSPSGQEDAVYLADTTASATHYIREETDNPNGTWTFSVYIKEADSGMYAQLRPFGLGSGVAYATFDPADGSVYESGGTNLEQTTSEDVGNGWYRVSITCSEPLVSGDGPMVALTDGTAGELPSYVGANEGVYLYGAQVEQASTPSSLIPTSGSSVTRAAETFTIPSANLPWPTPQYIGSELVDNGDFATTSDWSLQSGVSIGGGVLSSDGTSTGELARQSNIGVTSGNLYAISLDVISLTAGKFGVKLGGTTPIYFDTTGSHEALIVATATDNVQIMGLSGTTGSVDNISVREINPLSVSIGMDGRVTFANTWTSGTKQVIGFFRWQIDNDNKLVLKADSTDASGERLTSTHEVNNVADFATFNDFVYEGVLQSVNVALRVGSTFFQVAANGQTGAENATLTSLVDLSATDLSLAYDYMGTIGTFRVWDKDLGDTGIVEATNPSLEPSLSLTFEGTGTNSFVVNNWSE